MRSLHIFLLPPTMKNRQSKDGKHQQTIAQEGVEEHSKIVIKLKLNLQNNIKYLSILCYFIIPTAIKLIFPWVDSNYARGSFYTISYLIFKNKCISTITMVAQTICIIIMFAICNSLNIQT